MSKRAKSNVRKYKLFRLLVFLIPLLISILLSAWIDLPDIIFFIAALAIGYACTKLLHTPCLNKYIFDPLDRELDAPLHLEILRETKSLHPPAAIARAEYFAGNYSTVLDICAKEIADPELEKNLKFLYFFLIASCYFDLGDEKKLRETCETVNQALRDDPDKEKILQEKPIFNFLNQYINGDFDAACDYLNTPPPENTRIYEITFAYRRALIALRKGETINAKTQFERIIHEAPKLNFARLAQYRIDAIENNTGFQILLEETIHIDNNAPTEKSQQKKSRQIIKVIAIYLIISLICFWGIAAILLFT